MASAFNTGDVFILGTTLFMIVRTAGEVVTMRWYCSGASAEFRNEISYLKGALAKVSPTPEVDIIKARLNNLITGAQYDELMSMHVSKS